MASSELQRLTLPGSSGVGSAGGSAASPGSPCPQLKSRPSELCFGGGGSSGANNPTSLSSRASAPSQDGDIIAEHYADSDFGAPPKPLLHRAENLPRMAEAVRTLLECLGEDVSREGLAKTPLRMAKALLAITQGYEQVRPSCLFLLLLFLSLSLSLSPFMQPGVAPVGVAWERRFTSLPSPLTPALPAPLFCSPRRLLRLWVMRFLSLPARTWC